MLQNGKGRAVGGGAVGIFTSLALAGCAGFGLVEIGEERIQPFELDRSYAIANAPIEPCPIGQRELATGDDADAATVRFMPVADGCAIDIRVTGALLMTEAELHRRATRLEAQGDVDSMVGLDVQILDLVLADENDEPLELGGVVSFSLIVDGQTVLREEDVIAMRHGATLRVSLPSSFVDRFIDAVEAREALTGDLGLRLVVRAHDRPLPQRVHLRATLQPIAIVDAIAAKL